MGLDLVEADEGSVSEFIFNDWLSFVGFFVVRIPDAPEVGWLFFADSRNLWVGME